MPDRVILWVGLSNTIGHEALALDTNSGMLIQEIADLLPEFVHCKTNVVGYTPIHYKTKKMRYPTHDEMREEVPKLLDKFNLVKPEVVVLLGAQVARYILLSHYRLKAYDKNALVEVNGITFLPIDHPSYMLIYKHTRIPDYIKMVCDVIAAF